MSELSAAGKRDLLARLLRERAERPPQGAPALAPIARDGDMALSFGQERVWFLEQLQPESLFYNLLVRVGFSGRLDVEALRRSVEAMVARHEVLRTTFPTVDGRPVGRVSSPPAWVLPLHDLRELAAPARETEAERLTRSEVTTPFDLTTGPLLRSLLLRLADEEHVLVLTIHHIVSDGWSLNLLFRELAAFYAAFVAGTPPALPALPVQYADFAHWQRRWLTGDVLEAQRAYWMERLSGELPVLNLPTDRARPAMPTLQGATRSAVIDAAILAGLRDLSRREGVTLFTTMLTAFKTLLLRYTGQEDLIVGALVAGRVRPEVEHLMGFFVNTLALRSDFSGDPTFREALRRTRDVVVGAHAHADFPFERLVEELQPERDLSRGPLFQVALNMLSFGFGADIALPGVRARPLPSLELHAVTDGLTLYVFEGHDSLELCFVYSTALFDVETIARLEGHVHTLLGGIVADPDCPLSALPLLPAAERQQILVEWNATETGFPLDRCFAEHFEAQVLRTPNAVAVVDDGGTLTYAQLNGRANRLARRLVAAGVGPDQPVALLGERSIGLLTWMLAVFKAGAAYLPLDPRHPSGRHAEILGQSRARIVVVSDKLVGMLGAALETLSAAEQPRVLRSGDLADLGGDTDDLPPRARPGDLAYIIYTSGSTGVPKGATVQHSAMLNHFFSKIRALDLTVEDVVLQSAPQGFDISVWQFLAVLLVGGRVRIASDDVAYDPGRLLQFVERDEVTVLEAVPSFLHALLDNGRGGGEDAGCGRLRWLLVGGEVVPPALCRQWLERYPGVPVVHGYGPTECADDATRLIITKPPPPEAASLPIGRPIDNVRVYVVDRARQLVPIGVPGELCIGGAGVGRGYLNAPALTAEAFVRDPFPSAVEARLYRTGDRARWRPDGTLEFLGRLDDQVKIRGHRIELGEIEAVLARHPQVKASAAIVWRGAGGDRLAAYVVPTDALAVPAGDELRDHVRAVLPGYMVPDVFMVLAVLPLSPNGKVDRRALPEPELPARPLASAAPRTPAEELIANIWTEILGVERVGIHENFFELGGHSLLATQVISRLREAFAIDLPVRRMFEAPTVAGLAEHVEAARRTTSPAVAPPLRALARTGALPLSFAQQRLWFLDQLEPGTSVYNVPLVLELRGALDVAALEASVSEIVRRHEALRTTFPQQDGRPVQRIEPTAPRSIPVIDLRSLDPAARDLEARRLAVEDGGRAFDLARGPLVRLTLLRLDADVHHLLLTAHHIVVDGWSLDVFFHELRVLYAQLTTGHAADLPLLPVQYADFSDWQRQWLEGDNLEAQLEPWRRRLAGVPQLDLATDYPRPPVPSARGAAVSRALSPGLAAGLQALSQREGVTLFMTLLAGFTALLGRYSGQDDVAVGVPVAGRTRAETEPLIGLFVNTLVLRTSLTGDPTVRQLLHRVREVALEGYTHQAVPFERLVQALQPVRDPGRNPLFQVLFNMVELRTPLQAALPGLALRLLSSEQLLAAYDMSAKFDLSLNAWRLDGAIGLRLVYDADLFAASTMDRLLDHLERLLAAAVATPDGAVATLPVLADAEREQMLVQWNDTHAEYPADRCLHELFEAAAARTPEATAVTFEETTLTYQALNERANRVAHRLRGLGVGPEVVVGICVERSLEMLVGLLGILKAGGAYLPLDPDLPRQRLAYMLSDAGARVLVTQPGLQSRLPLDTPVLCLDADAGLDGGPAENPASGTGPSTLAYVLYTSGSTGQPKGTLIEHGSLVNYVTWVNRCLIRAPVETIPTVFKFTFDGSLKQLFAPLLCGRSVWVLPDDVAMDPEVLLRRIGSRSGVALNCVPSLWRAMLDALAAGAPRPPAGSLVSVMLGGESMTADIVRRSFEAFPELEIWNVYGPTETTCNATAGRVERDGPVTIGRPIANTQVYILDASQHPVPVGVPGELYVAGVGLARGYFGRPELTGEKFVRHPFLAEPDARVYRTGDRARYLADGRIEFLGRRDHQVKIRGFRIELEEIETTLRQHPEVREAAVVAYAPDGGDTRLVGYVVPAAATAPASRDLRQWLRTSLPDYMVPSAFVTLAALPSTAGGKLDRASLPPPLAVAVDARTPPRTEMETLVAGIWSEVLGVEVVGAEDNFFELGGHSLLATQVVSRLRAALEIDLPLRVLFEASTVEELAELVEASRRERATTATPPLVRVAWTGPPPLSFAQQRLWFFEQLEPGSAVYNMPLALRLRGRPVLAALEASLTEIARRHETLRTTFPSTDGLPVQRIGAPVPWPVPVVDLGHLPTGAREAEAERLAVEEGTRPFDLARGPLKRARLLRLDDELHVLLVSFHHVVADGWSLDVFRRELATLYEAHVTNRPPALPPLPVQYADFAAWQRQWLSGETLTAELAYWTRQLAGAPAALDLPLDHPRPLAQTFMGGACMRHLDVSLRDRLNALSRGENVTLFMTLLAAFNVVLGRQSGQEDVCVGVPVAGRTRPEIEGLIGLFLNTLVLRTRLGGRPSFRALVQQVRETALDAYAHQDVPFEKLVEVLQPARDLGRTPLFQVMLNMISVGDAATVELPGLYMEPAAPSKAWEVQSKFDLTLYVRDDPEGLTLVAVYNATLFTGERMVDLLDQLVLVLTAVAADPDLDVSSLSLLTASATGTLPDPTATLATSWTEPVTARFRRHAERAPDHPAVVTPTETWTYGQLEALSNQLARHLVEHGVGRGDLVAIYAHRSGRLAWALLGVLKAGAAFVCLDSAHPLARTLTCLRLVPPRACIHLDDAGVLPEAIRDHLANMPDVMTVAWSARPSDGPPSWSGRAAGPPVRELGPDDLAYVSFTSGSTGVPKAIAGTHGPLTHFFEWHAATSKLGAPDRFAALSGLGHDPLLRDVLGAFWVGATVCVPDPVQLGTLGYLGHWLAEQRVSVAHVTPGMATLLTEGTKGGDAGPLPVLRHVFFGGDALTTELVDRVRRLAPAATCVNFYGATETPQAVAWYRVPETTPSARWRIPLGQGIAGAQLLVVNATGELAGIGELGEIHVRTPNLSLGYLNDPALTVERFMVNPFTKAANDRVYRTGDLGRYRPDGTVEFYGRRDGQVKVRGFRVELGDVEAALRRCPGVGAAVVLARHEPGREPQVVAYVVGAGGESPASEELRRHVGNELPGYMVPSIFVAVDRLPLTPNGKVDLAALPAPPPLAPQGRRAPRTPTEVALATLWGAVLAIEAVGVEDNFFELGGHSLLAVTLFSRIEKVFGVTLPLATLFQAPTLERQAELIDQRGLDAPWRALVPIQPAGARPPLFAIPGLGGIVVAFNQLATLLGPDQPFYGLQPRGLDGRQPPFMSVEETAEHYLTEVRALQPQGPYFLMGVCMGGLVAFEMAQRLRAAGQEVAFLALLDVRPPHPLMRWMPMSRQRLSAAVLRLVASRLASYGRSVLQRPSRKQAREIFDRMRRILAFVATGDPLRGARGELYRQVVTAANASAMGHYVPRLYPGSLVLVLAADRKYASGKDRRRAWQQLATGGADICIVPGADSGLTLVDPNVRTLAEQFRARLERAQASPIDSAH